MSVQTKHFFIFGRFRLDIDDRLLWRDNETVPLTPKVFDTLLLLVENPGRVVTKDQFLEKLWPDNFVEEGSLSSAPATQPQIRTIAVLPFTLFNPEKEENLGIGMADTLITRLANTKMISVCPTSAVLKYANRE